MHPLCATLVRGMLCLGASASSPAAQPPASISLLSARPSATARLTLAPASFLGSGKSGPVLRLSNSTELTGGRILTSTGMTIRYSLTPSIDVGVGPSISKLDLPEGRVRAFEGVAFLRFSF